MKPIASSHGKQIHEADVWWRLIATILLFAISKLVCKLVRNKEILIQFRVVNDAKDDATLNCDYLSANLSLNFFTIWPLHKNYSERFDLNFHISVESFTGCDSLWTYNYVSRDINRYNYGNSQTTKHFLSQMIGGNANKSMTDIFTADYYLTRLLQTTCEERMKTKTNRVHSLNAQWKSEWEREKCRRSWGMARII